MHIAATSVRLIGILKLLRNYVSHTYALIIIHTKRLSQIQLLSVHINVCFIYIEVSCKFTKHPLFNETPCMLLPCMPLNQK